MIGCWIEDLAWPEVGEKLAARWPVIVPIGARAKEHGHHLPMCTDYLLARALAGGVAERLPVLVSPVVDFGYYPAFLRYPGSQHLQAATFIALLHDVMERLLEQGAAHLAIVNTGVSTEGPVQIAARDMLVKHRAEVRVADIRRLALSHKAELAQKLGGHGDEHETSLMLAIAPERVDMSRAREDYGNMLTLPEGVFTTPAEFNGDPASGHHHSATGVRGDPTLATVEKGRAILATMIDELVDGLRPLCPA